MIKVLMALSLSGLGGGKGLKQEGLWLKGRPLSQDQGQRKD